MLRDGHLGRDRRWGRRLLRALPALVVAVFIVAAWSSTTTTPTNNQTQPPPPVLSRARSWHFDRTRFAHMRHRSATVQRAEDGLTPQARAQTPLAPAGLPIT